MKNIEEHNTDGIPEIRNFMSASIQKDINFMKANLHKDFIFNTPRGTFFTFDSFLSDFMANPAFTIELFELLDHTSFQNEGLAIVSGLVHIKFAGQEEQYERMSFVIIKQDGSTKIVNVHGTFTKRPE